jgi:predicted HTH transcriptional regulator
MDWKEKAIRTLRDSLCPVPEELNELDWKSGLSNKSERLAQHISAFSNYKGGGMLVYGVNNDGTCFDLSKAEMDTIIEKLGNIAKNNLCYSITIDHSVMEYEGHALLFIYIPEQKEKPVYLRGGDVFDSYYRSAGQTVKMSRNQVKSLIAESQGITFEERPAKEHLTNEEVLELLDYKAFYERIDKNVPSATDTILNKMGDYGFCRKEGDYWCITNLGALLYANDIRKFNNLKFREIVIHKYVGTNNRQQEFEQHITRGYAAAFEDLIDFVMQSTGKEKIDVMRETVPTYPRVAIREITANMTLPAVKFTKGEEHTRVLLYPQKQLKDMTKQEKIDACYQHACLMFEEDVPINNQSVRERFELNKNKSSVASRIIADTLEAGFIKPADDETASKKYMTYIPFYG